jgi:hypothetical protein
MGEKKEKKQVRFDVDDEFGPGRAKSPWHGQEGVNIAVDYKQMSKPVIVGSNVNSESSFYTENDGGFEVKFDKKKKKVVGISYAGEELEYWTEDIGCQYSVESCMGWASPNDCADVFGNFDAYFVGSNASGQMSTETAMEAVEVMLAEMLGGESSGEKVEKVHAEEFVAQFDLKAEQKAEMVDLIMKMDSACSLSVSGRKGRLAKTAAPLVPTVFKGYDGSLQQASEEGVNPDGHREMYISRMPSNLVLLCANNYAKGGAVVLLGDEGMVLRLNEAELKEFRQLVDKFSITHHLKVVNNTYEVKQEQKWAMSVEVEDELSAVHGCYGLAFTVSDYFIESLRERGSIAMEEVCPATTYFNGKVNFNSVDEMILVHLLSGYTIPHLKWAVRRGTLLGLHPDITTERLSRYERLYGRTPDMVQISSRGNLPNVKAYEREERVLKNPGDLVQMDVMFSDFNKERSDEDEDALQLKASGKLETYGGAIAGNVTIDCYTGFIIGILISSVAKAYTVVGKIIEVFTMYKHTIKVFGADEGIIKPGTTRVSETTGMQLLRSKGIIFQQSEPNNHSNGTEFAENAIKNVKQLMRLAYAYLLSNNQVMEFFKWKKQEYLKLWGEVFLWAVLMLNLRKSYGDSSKTRYEAFLGVRPNVQEIRVLPIGSVLIVAQLNKGDKRPLYIYGIYMGPSQDLPTMKVIPGSVRVAVGTKRGVRIINTSKIKHVSEGGNLDRRREADAGLKRLLSYTPEQLEEMHEKEVATPIVNSKTVTEPEVPKRSNKVMVLVEDVDLEEEKLEDEDARDPVNMQYDDYQGDDVDWQPEQPVKPSIKPKEKISKEKAREKISEEATGSKPTEPEQGEAAGESTGDTGTKRAEDKILETIEKLEEAKKRVEKARKARRIFVPAQRAKPTALDLRHAYNPYGREQYKPSTREERAQDRSRARQEARQAEVVWRDAQGEWEEEILRWEAEIRAEEIVEESYFLDWSTVKEEEEFYIDLMKGSIVTISDELGKSPCVTKEDFSKLQQELDTVKFMDYETYRELHIEQGFVAVTEGVPKNFKLALSDPFWGAAARQEFDDVVSKCLVRLDPEVAKEMLKGGADLIKLFPVYEKKIRDGVMVYKVRLVGDGRTHFHADHTYAATPSREEFHIVLHITAANDWELVGLDEKRAFLKAERNDKHPILAHLRGMDDYYSIVNALYGLKSSTLDHQKAVAKRLIQQGFKRLGMCSCVYIKRENGNVILVYVYVDDFFLTGSSRAAIEKEVQALRLTTDTTEPVWNPDKALGMEIKRVREKRAICISMREKIQEMAKFTEGETRTVNFPLPQSRYLITDEDYAKAHFLKEEEKVLVTSKADNRLYLQMVGSLLWVQGVRHDIAFAVLYLTWFTHAPRYHHLTMARRVIRYLICTELVPLVLGGTEERRIITTTDASLATGPKGRSIIASVSRLSPRSGAVHVKTRAEMHVSLSSYQGEIGSYYRGIKDGARIKNILDEFGELQNFNPVRLLIGDNEKGVDFLNSDVSGEGIKHAELRFHYIREEIAKGGVEAVWRKGTTNSADCATKPKGTEEMQAHVYDVQGLALLD